MSGAAHHAGADFVETEECQVYQECNAYQAVYGPHVLEIEYTDQPAAAFAQACRTTAVTRRDRQLTPFGDHDHVEQ